MLFWFYAFRFKKFNQSECSKPAWCKFLLLSLLIVSSPVNYLSSSSFWDTLLGTKKHNLRFLFYRIIFVSKSMELTTSFESPPVTTIPRGSRPNIRSLFTRKLSSSGTFESGVWLFPFLLSFLRRQNFLLLRLRATAQFSSSLRP